LHDSIALEDRGIPTAAVATREFLEAAAVQARELGLSGYPIVAVDHPIQPLTREEVRERADRAIDDILRRLTAPSA
jgi:hypothetical protein